MTRRRTVWWGLVVIVAVVLWASWVPVPVVGRLDQVSPFLQLTAMRPVVSVITAVGGLLVGVCVARLSRAGGRRALSAPIATVVAIAAAALLQMAPRGIDDDRHPSPEGPRLVVAAANTLKSSATTDAIVNLVRQSDASVVALPETNLARARVYARALRSARQGDWIAYADSRFRDDDATPRPTAMVVRSDLRPRKLPASRGRRSVLGQVRVELTEIRQRVAAVHPLPPAPAASTADWRRDLKALRPLCHGGWLLAGDFNATLDHSPMRALLKAGCTDAAAATGAGFRATWHKGPVGLALDHVLLPPRWVGTEVHIVSLEGSDHRAVTATLASTAD